MSNLELTFSMGKAGQPGEVFSFGEPMDYLNAHPEVIRLNISVPKKA